jgi:hypothetical protein
MYCHFVCPDSTNPPPPIPHPQLRPAAWNCYIVCEKIHQQHLPASLEPYLRHDVALLHFALDSHLDAAAQLADYHLRSTTANVNANSTVSSVSSGSSSASLSSQIHSAATESENEVDAEAEAAEAELRALDEQMHALGPNASLADLDAVLQRMLAACVRQRTRQMDEAASAASATVTGNANVSANVNARADGCVASVPDATGAAGPASAHPSFVSSHQHHHTQHRLAVLERQLQGSLLRGHRGQRRQRLLLGLFDMLLSIRQQLAHLQSLWHSGQLLQLMEIAATPPPPVPAPSSSSSSSSSSLFTSPASASSTWPYPPYEPAVAVRMLELALALCQARVGGGGGSGMAVNH